MSQLLTNPPVPDMLQGPVNAGTDTPEPVIIRAGRRSWRAKFGEACRGVKLGVRGHSSFFVHFFCAAAVLAAAVVLRCDLVEWCLLLGCVTAVLAAELFNSAIDTVCRALDERARARARPACDIAAGAVLVAGAGAAMVGVCVFAHRLLALLS